MNNQLSPNNLPFPFYRYFPRAGIGRPLNPTPNIADSEQRILCWCCRSEANLRNYGNIRPVLPILVGLFKTLVIGQTPKPIHHP